jgi:hypothetical protein
MLQPAERVVDYGEGESGHKERGTRPHAVLYLSIQPRASGSRARRTAVHRRRRPPNMASPETPTCDCLLDLPGDLLQGVIQSLRPTELVAVERVCTKLMQVVRAHPFVAWLRKSSNWTAWDKRWFDNTEETRKARADWGHPRLCAALARDGSFELLQGVRSHNPPCPWGWQTGWEAFKRGDQAMLQWMAAHGYDQKEALELDVNGTSQNYHHYGGMSHWNDGFTLSGEAAATGDLELLKWLHMHGYNCFDVDDVEGRVYPPERAVASNGHLHVLEWLHAQGVHPVMVCLCEGAAMGGQTHILEWIEEVGHDLEDAGDMHHLAVTCGQVEVLEWLAERGIHLGPWYFQFAVRSGQLEVLKWMFAEGLDLTDDDTLCTEAAGAGHLAVLRWLRRHRCPFDLARCTAKVKAAIKERQEPSDCSTEGHEEVLSWLRALRKKSAQPRSRTRSWRRTNADPLLEDAV